MNKFLSKLSHHTFQGSDIQHFVHNIQAAAHERSGWKGEDFSSSDFFAGAFVFFATFPSAGPIPNALLDAARGNAPQDLFAPTPSNEIERLAASVQIDIHEGVLQPDEWQPVIDTVRTWLSQLAPAGHIPPLPINAIAELLEDAELTAHNDAKNGPVETGHLQIIRTWIDALQ